MYIVVNNLMGFDVCECSRSCVDNRENRLLIIETRTVRNVYIVILISHRRIFFRIACVRLSSFYTTNEIGAVFVINSGDGARIR